MFDWKKEAFPGYRPVREPWNTKIVDVHWKKKPKEFPVCWPIYPISAGIWTYGQRHFFQAYMWPDNVSIPHPGPPPDIGPGGIPLFGWWSQFIPGQYGMHGFDPTFPYLPTGASWFPAITNCDVPINNQHHIRGSPLDVVGHPAPYTPGLAAPQGEDEYGNGSTFPDEPPPPLPDWP